MRIIGELTDCLVGCTEKKVKELRERPAARAIVSSNGKIAILNVTKKGYHKLPGGGVEEGESILDGLKREILEEVGATVNVTGEVGTVVELRTHWKLKNVSHCFIAEVVKAGNPHFEPDEIEDGFKLEWMKIEEAIKIIKADKPTDYGARFVVKRELIFLKKALNLIKKSNFY